MEAIKKLIEKYTADLKFYQEHKDSTRIKLKEAEEDMRELEALDRETLDIMEEEYSAKWIEIRTIIIYSKTSLRITDGRIFTYEKVLSDLTQELVFESLKK
jgi:hypothetical protein